MTLTFEIPFDADNLSQEPEPLCGRRNPLNRPQCTATAREFTMCGSIAQRQAGNWIVCAPPIVRRADSYRMLAQALVGWRRHMAARALASISSSSAPSGIAVIACGGPCTGYFGVYALLADYH